MNNCCLQADMEEMTGLSDMRQLLMDRVLRVMLECCEHCNSFEHYGYLYIYDQKEFMQQFLLYGHGITSKDIRALAEDCVPENPPTLEHFREQLDSYESVYAEVQKLEPVYVFDGWMRVDARPFKSSLLNIIKKWSLMFKQHLIDHVTNRYLTVPQSKINKSINNVK